METLITAHRAGRAEHTPEAEPVLVTVVAGEAAVLVLDDGETLTFDHAELCAALEAPRAHRLAA
jgi:hypothetical protein